MLQSILTSILAFASTNVDDVFVLMLFYGLKKYKPSNIIFGQYVGIAALVLLSLLLALIGSLIDQRYVGLLGLFPIYLAIKQIIETIKEKDASDEEVKIPDTRLGGLFGVAGVTIANGGDNIGIYVPLFNTMDNVEKSILFIVFMVMVYIWCVIARSLAEHRLLASTLSKYAHIITPIVLFALGIFILYKSKSFTLVI